METLVETEPVTPPGQVPASVMPAPSDGGGYGNVSYDRKPRLPREEIQRTAWRIGQTQARLMAIAACDVDVITAALEELSVDNKARRLDPVVTGGGSPSAEARVRKVWDRLTAPRDADAFRRACRSLGRCAHTVRWNPLMTLAFHRAVPRNRDVRRRRAAARAYAQWRAAVNRLVAPNAGLAIHTVERYPEHGIPREDRYQAGMLGLMRAAERYLPGMRRAFSTYAVHWIRGANTHERRHGGDLTERAEQARDIRGPAFRALDDDTHGCTTATLPDRGPGPAESLAAGRDAVVLRSALQRLPARQRDALTWLYGLDGQCPQNRRSVARRMGLRERELDAVVDQGITGIRDALRAA